MSFVFYTPINDAGALLAVAHISGDGHLVLDDATEFAAASPSPTAPIRVCAGTCVFKIVGIDGTTLLIDSAVEGTTDTSLPIGTVVENRVTAADVTDLQSAITSVESIAGVIIGATVTGGSANSVLYVDASGEVAQSSGVSNPSWVTSLAGSKITGDISGNAASITGSVTQSQVTDLVTDLAAKATDSLVLHKVGGETITTSSAATKGLVIKGAASQTANLQELHNSSGSVLTAFNSNGTIVADFRNNTTGSLIKMIQDETDYPVTFNIGCVVSPQTGQGNAVFSMGWNTLAGAGREVTSEPTLRIGMENHYEVGGEYWMEGHLFAFMNPIDGNETRPYSVQIIKNPAGYTTMGMFQGESWAWSNQGQSKQIMTLTHTPSDGSVFLNVKGKNGSSVIDAFTILSNATTGYDYATLGRVGVSASSQLDLHSTVQSGLILNVGSQAPSIIGTVGNLEMMSGLATTGAISIRTDIFNIVDYASSVFRMRMLANGNFGIGTAGAGAQLHVVTNDVATKGFIVQGIVSQTANLFEAQDSTGGIQARISPAGYMRLGTGAVAGSGNAGLDVATGSHTEINAIGDGNPSIRAYSSTNTVMLKMQAVGSGSTGVFGTESNHSLGLATNNVVRFSIDTSGYVGINGAASSAQLQVNTSAATTAGVVVKGFASQTANLFDAQNSAGTSVASIDASGNLVTTGNFSTPNRITRTVTRTVPTTVGDAVDIGDFSLANGAAFFRVAIIIPSGGFSTTQNYEFTVGYDQTVGVWTKAIPLSSSGPYNGTEDTVLDLKMNGGILSMRLRRVAGTVAGTANIVIDQYGALSNTFTSSTTVNTVTAPTAFFPSTNLTQVSGAVGINTLAPSGQFQIVPNAASVKGAIVQGFASQTANLIEMQNSSGTGLACFDAGGKLGVGTVSPASAIDVRKVTTGGTTNFDFYNSETTSSTVGQSARLRLGAWNGFVGTNFHPYIEGIIDAASSAGIALGTYNADGLPAVERMRITFDGKVGINATSPGSQLQINAGSASTKVLLAKGTTSQTGNLIEGQTSAGTAVFEVTSGGIVKAVGLAPTFNATAKTTSYTLTGNDSTILGDATSAAFAITLPAANAVSAGRIFIVKKIDASANAVTVTRAGSDTIDGATTLPLDTQYASVILQSDGVSKWWVATSPSGSASLGATLTALSGSSFAADDTTSTFDLGSAGHIRWSSTSVASGTKDVGIKRTAAGEISITDGGTGVADLAIDALVVGTLTGMIKATSGSFSVATEGTDYLSGASNSFPLPYTFGGAGVPTIANDVTPWVYVGHNATVVRLTLSCKTAPTGNFQVTIKRSSDSGSTFPDTVATVTIASGGKLVTTTTITTTSLSAGDYLRCDVISVNGADTWSARLGTLSTNS